MASGGAGKNLAEEFEEAFQSCYASVVNEDSVGLTDSSEIKGTAELCINQLFEKARNVENFFLQRRLVISHAAPDQVAKEDIQELKMELARKDAMIKNYNEKLQQWQVMLRNVQSGQEGQSAQGQEAQFQGQGQTQPGQGQSFPTKSSMGASAGVYNSSVSQVQAPSSQGYLPQGPLAYLEQTTSNIR